MYSEKKKVERTGHGRTTSSMVYVLISAIGRVGGREEKIYVHEDDKEKDIRKLFFLFFEH